MTASNKLIQAATEAKCLRYSVTKRCDYLDAEMKHPECALAAALSALPVDEIRQKVREAVAGELTLVDPMWADDAADAASDVWIEILGEFS